MANFCHPPTDVYLTPVLWGFPLEYGNTGGHQETGMMWLSGREKVHDTCSHLYTIIHECDTQTDRQTDRHLCFSFLLNNFGRQDNNLQFV